MTSARKRVIVGVTGTLTNLQALRVAVDSARDRDAMLYAVHVWETGHNLESMLATAHKPGVADCLRLITQAFVDAMGGPPSDVDLRTVVVEGDPGYRLLRLAHLDTDLLVLGGSRPGRWAGSPTVRCCTRQARCPVLVVPAQEMARALPAAARGTRGAIRVPADWTA
ncbi:universal stress protein [Pseudonocardia sp. RS11V-5]|uniref:universal stress protein n=1 Tax=Pseudonocardia terrae TaxID=2905831 RepID=UPI001E5A6646|nr:universal stress protein [Pseudonocardia terrae]MCE3556419.1 universal stress protein [Pseudonocardia terrae]